MVSVQFHSFLLDTNIFKDLCDPLMGPLTVISTSVQSGLRIMVTKGYSTLLWCPTLSCRHQIQGSVLTRKLL